MGIAQIILTVIALIVNNAPAMIEAFKGLDPNNPEDVAKIQKWFDITVESLRMRSWEEL